MARGPHTVFFLSDYGQRDEFAGVVRAVLRALAPRAVVIDLTHEIPPFDVAAGAAALERALPYLGDGVVLAVVDPGVGTARPAVAIEAGTDGRRFFVGPDNGLLVPAAELVGGVTGVVELPAPAGPERPVTFDGRDVFAPAVARLCRGAPLARLGQARESGSLVRLETSGPTAATLPDGRAVLWCTIAWIDRFGNAQLNAGPAALADPGVLLWPSEAEGGAREATPIRPVRAFAELRSGEIGVLADSSGRLALVVREGSAAEALRVAVGDTVGLAEHRRGER